MPREIKILSVCFFVIFFAYNGVQQFLTAYFSDLNMVRVGFWSLILIYFSLLITNFFSGFIVSKFGAKKCLFFGSLFYSIFIFVLVAKNIPVIYLASALLGFGASILWTAQGVFLIRSSAQGNFGKNSGFFTTFFQLGSVLGIFIAGFLIIKLSFENYFLIFSSLPLIAAAIFLALGKAETGEIGFKDNFHNLKETIKNPVALKFSLIWLSFSLVIASVSGQFPLEIKKHFGLGSIAFITPIFYLLPIILSYYLGKSSDIRGRKVFLISAFIIVLLGLGLFILQNQIGLNKVFLILSFLIISLGYAIFAPLRFALLGDISANGNLEHLTAFSIFASNLGYVIVFLTNLYLPAVFAYLIPFFFIFLSLIIIMPVLKSNKA